LLGLGNRRVAFGRGSGWAGHAVGKALDEEPRKWCSRSNSIEARANAKRERRKEMNKTEESKPELGSFLSNLDGIRSTRRDVGQ